MNRFSPVFSPRCWRERGLTGFCGLVAALCVLAAVFLGAAAATFAGIDVAEGFAGPAPTSVQTYICRDQKRRERCVWVTRAPTPEDLRRVPMVERVDRAFALFTEIVPLTALAYGLFQAAGCFLNLARHRYFHRSTIEHLKRFAISGLAFVVLFPLAPTLSNGFVWSLNELIIRTHHGPYDLATASFALKGDWLFYILALIYALTLTVIAAVMAKAAALAEDYSQIV